MTHSFVELQDVYVGLFEYFLKDNWSAVMRGIPKETTPERALACLYTATVQLTTLRFKGFEIHSVFFRSHLLVY